MDRRDGYIMNEIMLRAENIERTYHAGSVDVPALKNCTCLLYTSDAADEL